MQGLLGRRPEAARHLYIWGWCQMSKDALHFIGLGVVKNMQGLLGRRPEAARYLDKRRWCQMFNRILDVCG